MQLWVPCGNVTWKEVESFAPEPFKGLAANIWVVCSLEWQVPEDLTRLDKVEVIGVSGLSYIRQRHQEEEAVSLEMKAENPRIRIELKE